MDIVLWYTMDMKDNITPNKLWEGKPKWLQHGREFVREQVRNRDKYKCRACKKKWVEGTRRFDVHHINGLCGKKSRAYDRLEDMDTLITVCHWCHYHLPDHSQNSG